MAENSKKSDKKSTTEETQQKKSCFVIMPFSDPEGYAPGHFRKIYDQIIKPAVENAGYEAYRVDENGVSDLITTKIFKAILDCDIAICDLSSRNPNVLYELGIRHAFDKPVVLIKDNKTDRIFDIQGISTVEYRRERLYDEVIEDQKKISEAIKANENNSSGYSILNMVNLQKATYDISIKDTNPSEINNALLMRILNALDKTEQSKNDNNKSSLSSGQLELNKLLADLSGQMLLISETFEYYENNEYTFEDINVLETEIKKTKTKASILAFNQYATPEQSLMLKAYLSDIGEMLDKIQKFKNRLY